MKLRSLHIAVVALVLFAASSLGHVCERPTTPCRPPPTTCRPPPPDCPSDSKHHHNRGHVRVLNNYDDCDDLPDGTVLVDKRHCRYYYVCQDHRPMRKRCSLGSWYDRSARECLPRAQVHNCPGY